MKTNQMLLLKLSCVILGCSLLLAACGAHKDEKAYADEPASGEAGSSAKAADKASQEKKEIAFKADSGRVFVRTADLNFKVKDVKLATFDIERIVRDNRGYVTSTALESTINHKNAVRVSKDSLKETIRYQVHNDIIIRVPNSELDNTLSQIAVLFDYLDHRRVYAQDITKDLQMASLSQANFKNHKTRVEKVIDEKGKKLNSTLEAENSLFEKQDMANQVTVETKELNYNVAYSTLKISIYQNESIKTDMLAFSEPVTPYEPPFSEKLMSAGSTGGHIFGEIFLFIIRLWPIWLLAVGVWLLARKISKLKWFN